MEEGGGGQGIKKKKREKRGVSYLNKGIKRNMTFEHVTFCFVR